DPVARRRFEAGTPFVPPRTHARNPDGDGLKPWTTVSEALKDFPPLDAADEASAVCPTGPFHRVPVLEPRKYEWVRRAPPGRSAFDNQCVAAECRHQGNRTHGSGHGADGINRARRDTPLYCERCGALLPRPCVESEVGRRIMSGYTIAYKRMDAGLPA